MRDDTVYENEDVKEAIKRLPEDVRNERLFRIKRALDLSMRQQILPKEQWIKYEEGNTTCRKPTLLTFSKNMAWRRR
uniref:Cytochrome b-c1 complex subunit 7 n=1 Tax=Podarcis muralis TaxID=64176 RepID=A0A670K8K6_PODMU